jgi:type I restriction enzyme M protein
LYAGKNYSIDIIVKPNLKLNVWLDKDAFKDVIENLIDNAKSHGFIDDTKNYRIVFELSKLENEADVDEYSTQYARIIYKNDGKSFPKDFSFDEYKQYSNKAGRTQGTGIGGYVVNKLIELHDGIFSFITPSDDFTVEFEILLPLEDETLCKL